ncbi:MAG: Tol-Pal system beta propeller repeat protein TolB, partial [Candidatus Hydrogenedentes bacterium]|nr:Tol-Pal system beta propeller repeat protein TolB [Candidatus Hydrogenedentota bacterium]
MNRNTWQILMVLCTMVLATQSVWAQMEIESRRNIDARIPIAVPPCASTDPALAALATELAQVVADDLAFSGLFSVLSADRYPAGFTALDPDVQKLNRDLWASTKAEHLVFGNLKQDGDQLVTEFRLFDLFTKTQVFGLLLKVDKKFPRLAAHHFSEQIILNLDGTEGIGTSEICFSAGATGSKEIYVADYDGANVKQVTKHNSISIKPKFSPDGTKIAYLSYKDRYTFLYVFDRITGKSVPLSKEVGLNIAPAWSPDGKQLAHVLSKDGNNEIYLRNADGTNLHRLTRNRDVDTSPVFAPSGTHIAFVSDRGGSAQIYSMDLNGENTKRLSYQGGASYDPAWSPDGKFIAYVAEKRGDGLEIYVMNADGSSAQRVSNSQGSNESPSWSADSRHIVFSSTRHGQKSLYNFSLESGEERKVPRISLSSEGPSWG